MVEILDFILHLDVHIGELIAAYGTMVYALLFAVVFVETGLVFFPFLPGDSLLFVAGAFAALGALDPFALVALLSLAAVLGDTLNYWMGRLAGDRLAANPRLPVKAEHLERTRRFFEKHGGKTIVLARFVPIVRTFAPFVAGAGRMPYARFFLYNITGGIAWVFIGVAAGCLFGNVPLVKDNFTYFLVAIVVVSLLPALSALRKEKGQSP